jgi:ABC-type Fe3+-siderophore transport system permease subunit
MENTQTPQKTNAGKMSLYLLGYFVLGIFYLVINSFPIPLGGFVGAVRIWQWAKKDSEFNWKIRLAVLLVAVILGSGIFALSLRIPFSLSFGQH